MSKKKTEAIVARLRNRERVNYLPAESKISPRAFVVVANGDVCPLDSLNTTEYLNPIFIEDGELFCDVTVSSTNTEITVNGKSDFKEAVKRYNEAINEKRFRGETDDDDGSKIIDYHAF